MRTLTPLCLVALAGCVTTPNDPAKVTLPPGTQPFDGCKTTTPTPSDHVFDCGGWTATYAEVEGATPDQLRVEMGRELKARLPGEVKEDSASLSIGGAPTPVARFTARTGEETVSVLYFLAMAVEGRPTRLVTCTAEKGAPAALAHCELALDALATGGLPSTAVPEHVTRFVGKDAALPAGCVYGGGLTAAGGRVRCGDDLVLRWDGLPANADALHLDNFAAGLQQELGGAQIVERDAPACTFRGAAAVCVRLKAKSGYTFLLAQSPPPGPLLVNCGFRDANAEAKGFCLRLVAVP